MKKVFLTLTLMGLITLTSCKKEADKVGDTIENADQTLQETTESYSKALDESTNALINIPQFSDPKVQEYANEVAKYYEELGVAAKEGNQEKLNELLKKQVEVAQQKNQLLQGMNAEDAKKLETWLKEAAAAAQQ